jgi:segregation and condensation protein B
MQRPAHLLRAFAGLQILRPMASELASGSNQLQYNWPGSRDASVERRRWWFHSPSIPAAASPSIPGSAATDAAEFDDEPPIQRRRRAEAVLLFHRGPVNLRRLAALARLADATEARTRIREINELYDRTGSALRVEEVAGGHQLLTRPALAPWLRRMKHVPSPVQLGSAAMETLAIIAYRQPVLRADIEAIRGVACGELVRQLMQKDLVRICGRSEELGRPYLYGTTPYFLQIFGLKNAGSFPAIAGASIQDESDDTLANSELQGQAPQQVTPIETPNTVDLPLSALSPFDAVTPKESDVSIAPGPVVIDEATDLLSIEPSVATSLTSGLPDVVAVDEDEDEDFFDDDEDDDEEDVWDDDEEDADDEDDEELDDEWEEVGDEDEAEVDDVEEDEVVADVEEELDEDDEEEDDVVEDEEEEDEWEDDDDEDDAWEDEDEEDEEWD